MLSCVLASELHEVLEQKFSVTFVDRVDLQNWAATSSELAKELDRLIETDPSDSYAAGTRCKNPRRRSKPLWESQHGTMYVLRTVRYRGLVM